MASVFFFALRTGYDVNDVNDVSVVNHCERNRTDILLEVLRIGLLIA